MDDIIGSAIIIFFLTAFTYLLLKQCRLALTLRKRAQHENIPQPVINGHMWMSVALFGTIVAYALNTAIGFGFLNNHYVTSSGTSLICIICFIAYLIIKFRYIPAYTK